MLDRIIKSPGPDHPITVEATGHRVIIMLGGRGHCHVN